FTLQVDVSRFIGPFEIARAFFFSSRRRHTRSKRDWSSDVCSSDLIRRALEAGVGRIVIDSLDEIDQVDEIAARLGLRAGVMLRVTTGVEAHTHEFIATAHEDQKFGLSLPGGSAFEAVHRVLDAPQLDLLGLHSHIGSQIFDTGGFEVAARRVLQLVAQVRDELGHTIDQLDLGGGFGVMYNTQHTPSTPEALA